LAFAIGFGLGLLAGIAILRRRLGRASSMPDASAERKPAPRALLLAARALDAWT
jgi:hypothetical protein